MNNIDKEIEKLIQPYTDKTLTDGCLIEINNINWIRKINSNIQGYFRIKWYTNEFNINSDITKILWHYDITAVLKYIEQLFCVILEQWFFQLCDDDWKRIENEFRNNIPNKPLHLYTEQEKKDLLELLLNLKR